MRVWLILCVLCAAVLSPSPVAAQGATNDCMLYAYSYDGYGHYSLVQSDSIIIGTMVMVESNCGSMEVQMNNRTIQYFENVTVFEIPVGSSNLKMVSDVALFSFENVTAYPRANVWNAIDTPSFHDPDSTYLTGDEISNKEIMVSFGTGVIVWLMVTMVLWRFINSYVDRNLCEEVRA